MALRLDACKSWGKLFSWKSWRGNPSNFFLVFCSWRMARRNRRPDTACSGAPYCHGRKGAASGVWFACAPTRWVSNSRCAVGRRCREGLRRAQKVDAKTMISIGHQLMSNARLTISSPSSSTSSKKLLKFTHEKMDPAKALHRCLPSPKLGMVWMPVPQGSSSRAQPVPWSVPACFTLTSERIPDMPITGF